MDNPLTAIPEILPGVEAREDAQGRLQLLKPRLYTGGWSRWLALKLRWRADTKIHLDDYGTFYWRQINGRNTLDQIAAAFSERHDRPLADSRRAVVQFTRDLMLRRLINLKTQDCEACP